MCEEFEFYQDRSGEPDVLVGQSIVLSEIKTEVPLQNDDPSHHEKIYGNSTKNESNCIHKKTK